MVPLNQLILSTCVEVQMFFFQKAYVNEVLVCVCVSGGCAYGGDRGGLHWSSAHSSQRHSQQNRHQRTQHYSTLCPGQSLSVSLHQFCLLFRLQFALSVFYLLACLFQISVNCFVLISWLLISCSVIRRLSIFHLFSFTIIVSFSGPSTEIERLILQ